MPESNLCPRCGDKMIPECNGRTYFFGGGEGAVVQCPNIRRRAIRARFLQEQYLGMEMVSTKGVYPNPLLGPDVDLTQENVFITKCGWRKFLAYLKYPLTYKLMRDREFSFGIITDEDIKRVFVGAEAYRAKSPEDRELSKSYNSLADLVRGPHLLIIRLGFLGYQNRAAAGALYETLLHRDVVKGPTWLVEERKWNDSRSFNIEVDMYVQERFPKVTLPDVEDLEEGSEHDPVPSMEEDDSMIEEHVAKEGPPKPGYYSQNVVEDDEDDDEEGDLLSQAAGPMGGGPMGGGGSKKKPWKRGRK